MTQRVLSMHDLVTSSSNLANKLEISKIHIVNHMYTYARGVGFILHNHRGEVHTLSDRSNIKHDDLLSCVSGSVLPIKIFLLRGDNYLGGDGSGINKLSIIVDWSNLSFKFTVRENGKEIKISEQKSLRHFEGAWSRISELNGIDY